MKYCFSKNPASCYCTPKEQSSSLFSGGFLSQLQTTTLTVRANSLSLYLTVDVIFPAWLPHEGSNEQLSSSSAGKRSWRPDLDTWCWLFTSLTGWVCGGKAEGGSGSNSCLEAKGSLLVYLVNKNAQCWQSILVLNKIKVEGFAGWGGGFCSFYF